MNDDYKTSWRKGISEALEHNSETWKDVESITLTEEQLDKRFSDDYGGTEGDPFTVWTAKKVYFPWCYDGAEGVAFVSRHPDGIPTHHVGGG